MGWLNDQPITLVIPSGAGPNDPRIVIGAQGSDLPASLINYYLVTFNPTLPFTVVGATIYFDAQGDYFYEALIRANVGITRNTFAVTGVERGGIVAQYTQQAINQPLGNPEIVFSVVIGFRVAGSLTVGNFGDIFIEDGEINILNGTPGGTVISVGRKTDPQEAMIMDRVGSLFWGSGTAPEDATFYRSGVGTLASSPIVADVGNLVSAQGEIWHGITPLNNFANRGAGFPALSCRKVAAPANSVELVGQIVSGVTTANGTQIGAVPAGYAPATQMAIDAENLSHLTTPLAVTVETTGAVKLFGSWANGDVIKVGPDTYPRDL